MAANASICSRSASSGSFGSGLAKLDDLFPKLTRHGLGFAGVERIGVGIRAERLPPDLLADVASVAQYAGPEIVEHEPAESLHLGKAFARPPARVRAHRPAAGTDLVLQFL